jgi:hypothetical protein
MSDQLRPGSRVSFYFSGGPHAGRDDERIRQRMFEEITSTGEIVLGYLSASDIVVETDIISGPSELTEHLMHHPGGEQVIWGTWPAPMHDGHQAVTVDLVDVDGVMRSHPH